VKREERILRRGLEVTSDAFLGVARVSRWRSNQIRRQETRRASSPFCMELAQRAASLAYHERVSPMSSRLRPPPRCSGRRGTQYAQERTLRHTGGVPAPRTQPPDVDREGGSPLGRCRDQITRFSVIFDPRAVALTAGSTRSATRDFDIELLRTEPRPESNRQTYPDFLSDRICV